MKVWMKVTRDQYELPIAIADSPQELSMLVGSNADNINSCIAKVAAGVTKKSQYVKVEIEDYEE